MLRVRRGVCVACQVNFFLDVLFVKRLLHGCLYVCKRVFACGNIRVKVFTVIRVQHIATQSTAKQEKNPKTRRNHGTTKTKSHQV